MSATRLLIRCMVKYCKMLMQTSSWWWTITCSKHVEDNLSENKLLRKGVHLVGLSHVYAWSVYGALPYIITSADHYRSRAGSIHTYNAKSLVPSLCQFRTPSRSFFCTSLNARKPSTTTHARHGTTMFIFPCFDSKHTLARYLLAAVRKCILPW